jgi:hypothetical protein
MVPSMPQCVLDLCENVRSRRWGGTADHDGRAKGLGDVLFRTGPWRIRQLLEPKRHDIIQPVSIQQVRQFV